MAATDVKIQGSTPGKFRHIDKGMMETSVSRTQRYVDPELAELAKLITIFEGNGKPYGITGNQDVSAKRLRPSLKEEIMSVGGVARAGGRISVDNIPRDIAMQAILEDKKASLVARGRDSSKDAVAEKWNTEKGLKEQTGNSYSEWLGSVYKDITDQFANEAIRKLMNPPKAANSSEVPLTPTLDLLQGKR